MNPLKQYMKKHNVGFLEMKQLTGLSEQTLRKIARLDEVGILNMRLRTILVLKKNNIDMAKHIKYSLVEDTKLTHKKSL
jgi:hypothetical protein